MSLSDFLVRLDALGLAAAGWIATWFVHSVILCVLALALKRLLRAGSLREGLYKVALVGALFTTGAQALGVGVGASLQYELSASSGAGRPIVIAGRAPVQPLTERSQQPAAAAAQEAALVTTAARWRWAHLLPLAAIAAALVGAAGLLREQRRLRRAIAERRAIERPEWRADLDELARRAGLARAPRLSSSASLGSPIALARGELVVPQRALDELDRDARRALLAHELAHLARRDPQWLVATALVERLLAIQPLQRLVRRRLVDEIELACDAQAVVWTGGGLPLARCLATVAGWIAPAPAQTLVASMAARDSALVRRVERALAPACASTTVAQRRVFCLSVAAMLALLACSGPKVEPTEDSGPTEDRVASSSTDEEQLDALRDLGYIGSDEDDEVATLVFASDGSIRAGDELLYDPADGSYEPLDAHLARLVEHMETQPLDPAYPDGFQLAMGELVLQAEAGAPMRGLQKAMVSCGRIGIWDLRFTGDWPGGEEGYPVPLPFDLDEIEVPVEDRATMRTSIGRGERAPGRQKIDVTMRVLTEGRKLDPVSGAPWSGAHGSRFVYDDSRVIEYQLGPRKTRSLEEVAAQLRSLHAQAPDWSLTIDPRKGTVYRDVVGVLDAGLAAGFKEVTFVGSYE